MTKKIAIVQSCYIPWKGYFDIINSVDEFILYDDMQYTKRDWRNRNLIKTPNGLQWLTIPVDVKGKYFQKINEVKISDKNWAKTHWKAIALNYGKAEYFKQQAEMVESWFRDCESEDSLSYVNFKLMSNICTLLNIRTKISWSTDYIIDDSLKKTKRLVALCQAANAAEYVSGPSAKTYIETDQFKKMNIELTYVDYSGYPVYQQLFGEFQHGVTILDLIFNLGSEVHTCLKSVKRQS